MPASDPSKSRTTINVSGGRTPKSLTGSRITIEHPGELDVLAVPARELGIEISVIDREMRVVWSSQVAMLDRMASSKDALHCFAAKWGRSRRCPDCLPLLVFRTGEGHEGLRERGRPGRPKQVYRVHAIPIYDPSGDLRWVMECTIAAGASAASAAPEWIDSQMLLRLPQASGRAVVVIDLKDRIVSWSPAATLIFGYELEDTLGRKIDLLVPSDRLDESEAIAAQLTRDGELERTGTVRRARDGRLIPVELSALALRDEKGELVGYSLVFEDLSAVRKLRDRLQRQEQLLAHITRDAADPILGMALDGTITSWNRGAEQLFGYSQARILGRALDTLTAPEAAGELLDRVRTASPVRGHRMDWRDASGQPFSVDVTAALLEGTGHEARGITCVVRDLTGQIRLTRQMVRSEKLAAVGSLAAGLAHEIGTPLNVISASVEYMLLDLAENNQQREELENILAETGRISKLVRELLSSARDTHAVKEPVHPSEAVERVLRLIHGAAEKRSIKVDVEVSRSLPLLHAHPDGMHQLLLNLLLNAIHAVGEGGAIKVVVREPDRPGISDGGTLILEIHDDGPGVPEDVRERIFDPFFTTRGDGTGLGLAVCNRVVASHGGDIRVCDSDLGGACFVVQLPQAVE